jgi:hypothetical protein
VIVVRIVAGLAGAALVVFTLQQAIRTFVVPRGVSIPLSRAVFIAMRRVFQSYVRLRGAEDDRAARDDIMAHWAPLSLVALPAAWLLLSLVGYAAIDWAVTYKGIERAVEISGSSLLTLGFAAPGGFVRDLIAFSEAAVGIALLALVIAYLPTIYGAYSRRELIVSMLDSRAGIPPSAVGLMLLHHRFGGLERLDQKWSEWEQWVVDIGETHTTHPSLPFFRSADSDHSWLTAVGALLDAANLRLSAIVLPGGGNADAWMYLRSATRVVRDVAGYFQIPIEHEGEPALAPDELDAALDTLAEAGVPVDREHRGEIWDRFAARRALYEPAVLGLAGLLDVPPAPWTGDRATPGRTPPIFRRRRTE